MNKVSHSGFVVSIVVAVIGAIINFYATNMILSDISNAYAGLHDIYLISSIPAFMIACLFILALLYLGRRFLRPQYIKALSKLYLIIGLVISFIGFVTSILSGTIVYHSFVGQYPFPGYSFLMLITFIMLLGLFGFQLFHVIKKMPDDQEKRKPSFLYGLYTALLIIFIYFAINRLGAVLWSPFYIQGRTFYLTWSYYLWLLLPMVLLCFVIANVFKIHEVGTVAGVIKYGVFAFVGLTFSIVTLVLGMTNTQFVSAISPTVGVERLLAKPVDTILQLALFIGFTSFFLIREIRALIVNLKKAK
mgnify:CR=1 FL=1